MAKFDRKEMVVTVMDCDPKPKKGGVGETCHLGLNPVGAAFCSDKQKHLWPALRAAQEDGGELTVELMETDTDRDGNPYLYVMKVNGVEEPDKPAEGQAPAAGPAAAAPAASAPATSRGPLPARELTPDQRCENVRSLAIMMSAGWIINLHAAMRSIEDYVNIGMPLKSDGIQAPADPRADRATS